ncbi:arginase [Bradyrhizobium jicamae]|uniref:Arginase n=1 Tax=Bradyrhizobium jicamae TaxID=280332 RepID=A0ABS5FCC8_9BRAD|nr:arginase [Bradyrhizobium jicamae]MBR0794448.1 arginase [Bradyrhizobium jicamae]MBR0933598.1 arginase [Bradyrhizobium jicamae]
MSEADTSKHQRIALLGVPIEIGASQAGPLMGPDALRTAGIARLLEQLGFQVDDHGNLAIPAVVNDGPVPANTKFYDEVKTWTRALSERAYWLAHSGAIPIFMGGDHSLSMGSINGVARYWQEKGRPLFALWVDAHTDYNTPATTITGNMHGMSAAFLCGEDGLDDLLGGLPRATIPPDQLDVIGARSIDPLERKLLKQRNVSIADMRQIDEFGVAVLTRRVIDRVRAKNGVLHVSFDVDFLDPSVAPGVGTTVPGGATYREAHLIMELLHDSGLVRSLDIVELNPFLDERGRTARVAVELIGSLFGLQITDRQTPTNAVLPEMGE